MSPKYWLCDYCDGCGWYEGGKCIQTKCDKCDGHGVVLTEGRKILTTEQAKEVKAILKESPLTPADYL